MIYLDYNAMAPLAPECKNVLIGYLESGWANPSSKHEAGEHAKTAVNMARAQVARLLNAAPAEIVFTSGGTESNHQAILGALALQKHRRHVVTSAVEHPSTLQLLSHLERTQNVRVTRLPVDAQGRLDPAQLDAVVTEQTALVTLLWANNETGVLFPIEQIARRAKAKGALFHTDAVQAIGKLPVDLAHLDVDLLSLSGHKIHGPPGVGALFVRKGIKLPPLLHGHQERGRRGGTENVPGVVALGVACELACATLHEDICRIGILRDYLERGVRQRFPFATINGGEAERVSNTSNIRFAGLDGDFIVNQLGRLGVCVSQGAACSAWGSDPSHVLTAMGLDEKSALASLRFSLGRYTTVAQIDVVLGMLTNILADPAGAAA